MTYNVWLSSPTINHWLTRSRRCVRSRLERSPPSDDCRLDLFAFEWFRRRLHRVVLSSSVVVDHRWLQSRRSDLHHHQSFERDLGRTRRISSSTDRTKSQSTDRRQISEVSAETRRTTPTGFVTGRRRSERRGKRSFWWDFSRWNSWVSVGRNCSMRTKRRRNDDEWRWRDNRWMDSGSVFLVLARFLVFIFDWINFKWTINFISRPFPFSFNRSFPKQRTPISVRTPLLLLVRFSSISLAGRPLIELSVLKDQTTTQSNVIRIKWTIFLFSSLRSTKDSFV